MICYKDVTFCNSACATADCTRKFTDELIEKAKEWWGGPDAPIAVSSFKDNCDFYIEEQPK